MNIIEVYDNLTKHSGSMSFNPPAKESDIVSFEADNSLCLPESYKELLKLFNGGELFVPGTKVYGINREEAESFISVTQVNRTELLIPTGYFIVAKLNYGDYICLNFNPPYDVIQWDNSKKCQYLSWLSFESWLASTLNFGYSPTENGSSQFSASLDKQSAHSIPRFSIKRFVIPAILTIIPLMIIVGATFNNKNKMGNELNHATTSIPTTSTRIKTTETSNANTYISTLSKDDSVLEAENSVQTYTTATEEPEDTFRYGVVNTIKDPLNVRKQPTTKSDKIGAVDKGLTVAIIGETEEWYQIKYGDQTGYVSKLYIILNGEPQSEVVVTGVVVTKKDSLNVREQPNENAKILGSVPKGDTVSIVGDDGEWYEIIYGTGKGYVSKKYVQI